MTVHGKQHLKKKKRRNIINKLLRLFNHSQPPQIPDVYIVLATDEITAEKATQTD